MGIAVILILAFAAVAVGVPFIIIKTTDSNRSLPPGETQQHPGLPSGGATPEYEVYDEASGTYSIVSSIVDDDSWTEDTSPRLTRVPVVADSNTPRAAKRALRLVNESAAPVKEQKGAFIEQILQFEKIAENLDEDLEELFTRNSLTYRVYMSAVATAKNAFWNNVQLASKSLSRFDEKQYAKMQNELSRTERLMFDAFDARVLADQIAEAANNGAFENINESERAEINKKAAVAKELASQGKQLQARELLSDVKEMIVSKKREENPAYIRMKKMEGDLAESEELFKQNENLVDELKRLSSELQKLNSSSSSEKMQDILDEIARLSDNVRKYE